jgi:hypothetical protein
MCICTSVRDRVTGSAAFATSLGRAPQNPANGALVGQRRLRSRGGGGREAAEFASVEYYGLWSASGGYARMVEAGLGQSVDAGSGQDVPARCDEREKGGDPDEDWMYCGLIPLFPRGSGAKSATY